MYSYLKELLVQFKNHFACLQLDCYASLTQMFSVAAYSGPFIYVS